MCLNSYMLSCSCRWFGSLAFETLDYTKEYTRLGSPEGIYTIFVYALPIRGKILNNMASVQMRGLIYFVELSR